MFSFFPHHRSFLSLFYTFFSGFTFFGKEGTQTTCVLLGLPFLVLRGYVSPSTQHDLRCVGFRQKSWETVGHWIAPTGALNPRVVRVALDCV